MGFATLASPQHTIQVQQSEGRTPVLYVRVDGGETSSSSLVCARSEDRWAKGERSLSQNATGHKKEAWQSYVFSYRTFFGRVNLHK